jgi:hypothetical protein
MNALIRGEEALILRVHKAGHKRLRAIAAADHLGDQSQRLVDGDAIVLAGIVHRGKVSAGDKGDFVVIPVVIGRE